MPTYLVQTKSGSKGPFSLRVILKGIETGKIPPTATLQEVETGRPLQAGELLISNPDKSNSENKVEPPVTVETTPIQEPAQLTLANPEYANHQYAQPPYPPAGVQQYAPYPERPQQQSPVYVQVQQQVGPKDNTTPMMALLGFLFAITCCLSPLGLIFSIIGYRDAQKRGGAGKGLALAGIIISGLVIFIWLAQWLVIGLGFGAAVDSVPSEQSLTKSAIPTQLEPSEMKIDDFTNLVHSTNSKIRRLDSSGASYKDRMGAREIEPRFAYVGVRIVGVRTPDSSDKEVELSLGWGQLREDYVNGAVPAKVEFRPFDPRTGQPVHIQLSPQNLGYVGNHQGGLEWLGNSTLTLKSRMVWKIFDERFEESSGNKIPFEVASSLSKGDIIVIKLTYPDEYAAKNPQRTPEVDFEYSPYQPGKTP